MKRTFLVSLGTFDGLHRGHRKLIALLRADARRLGLKVLVALFAEPPRFHFQPRSRASLLTTASERKSLLLGLGVDRVEVLRFDAKLSSMSHERFFEEVLLRRFKAGGLVAGPDFAFGKGRKGDCAFLRRECAKRGLHFRMLPPVRSGLAKISSSAIRDLLRCGRVERAAKLLGRTYAVSGRVIRGRGLGAKIGFPTANLRVEGRLLPMGVFEVLVRGPSGTAPSGSGERPPSGDRGPLAAARAEAGLRAVCNIGYRPTVEKDTPPCGPHVEVHIPGFRGDLYGKTLTIEFLRLLRYEKRFASLKALVGQIRRDIARVRS